MDIINGIIQIEGNIQDSLVDEFGKIDIFIRNDCGDIYLAEWIKKDRESAVYNNYTLDRTFFVIKMELNNVYNSFSIYIRWNEKNEIAELNFCKYIKLYRKLEFSYCVCDDYIITYDKNNRFSVINNLINNRVRLELKVLSILLKEKQYKNFLLRLIVFFTKEIKKMDLWIFIDRLDKADDNAEVLYEYCMRQRDGIKKVFLINDSSKDYERLRKRFNVVPYGTYKAKLLMILADKIISSHVDVPMRYPFAGNGYILRSFSEFKFIFLQHGVIKDNLSDWLNKYNKNIQLFITSTKKEYESIIKEDYGYTSDVVKLTGLPRYDRLNDKSLNQIVIMPTWRNSLVNDMNSSGEREYSPEFKTTTYYNQYNMLINDTRLIDIAKTKGIKILFMPHPNMQCQINDFCINDMIEIVSYDVSYNKIICESKMLITDYSSIAFDFAYMRKPIVYHQFDYIDVFKEQSSHIYKKGYFDYETMGFGPVSYNYEDTINYILNYINNDFKINKLYSDRADSFFEFKDKKNCERVYEEIRRMK